MYILKKDVVPGMVVWGEKTIYYDQPGKMIDGKHCMYVVTKVNEDHFLGCPLTTQTCRKNSTVLSSKNYPIKYDSRIRETIYKVYYDQIVSPSTFMLTERTFEHFKRNLYKRIMLGKCDSPSCYNEPFAEEYFMEHVPSIGDVLVYPSDNKQFKYYYTYGETEEDYLGVPLELNRDDGSFTYTIVSSELVNIPKSTRYFDIYSNHSLTREEVDAVVNCDKKQKTLGSRLKNIFGLKKQ